MMGGVRAACSSERQKSHLNGFMRLMNIKSRQLDIIYIFRTRMVSKLCDKLYIYTNFTVFIKSD